MVYLKRLWSEPHQLSDVPRRFVKRTTRARQPAPGRRIVAVFAALLLLIALVPGAALADDHKDDKPDKKGKKDHEKDAKKKAKKAGKDDSGKGRTLFGVLERILAPENAADEPAEEPETKEPARQGALPLPPDLRAEGRDARPAGGGALVILSGFGGLLLLGLALVVGRRAARPRTSRLPPEERGRRRALDRRPRDAATAVKLVAGARYGKLRNAELSHEAALISLKRKRRASCEEVQGYLRGAFEAAWGRDVNVGHEKCGKRRACDYEVKARVPTPGPTTSSALPGGEASIQES